MRGMSLYRFLSPSICITTCNQFSTPSPQPTPPLHANALQDKDNRYKNWFTSDKISSRILIKSESRPAASSIRSNSPKNRTKSPSFRRKAPTESTPSYTVKVCFKGIRDPSFPKRTSTKRSMCPPKRS